jgi:hypothetical protein
MSLFIEVPIKSLESKKSLNTYLGTCYYDDFCNNKDVLINHIISKNNMLEVLDGLIYNNVKLENIIIDRDKNMEVFGVIKLLSMP